MIISMNKEVIIETMTREALKYVKYYFTDLTVYDIPEILNATDGDIYYWFVRESGTHLISMNTVIEMDAEEGTDIIDTLKSINDMMYKITLTNGKVELVWDKEIMI